MYLDYFGLDKNPFRITPDVGLFYQGKDRGAILQMLCFAIQQGEGIMKVVGEVGTGKTMLCRMLPDAINDDIDWIYLAHPNLTPDQIVHAIAFEMEIETEQDEDKLSVMRKLQDFLLEKYHKNRKVVLLVEEAQAMPIETLEEIRLISNLETAEQKLMQIILFGQPELDENLSKPKIRQLRERITHSVELLPFNSDDVQEYLNFRLRACGYTGPDLFSASIAKKIAKSTGGLIRRVNIIADKIMIIACSQNRHNFKNEDVNEALKDSEFCKSKKTWPLWSSFGIPAILAALIAYDIESSFALSHLGRLI